MLTLARAFALFAASALLCAGLATDVAGEVLPFETDEIRKYLLIGMADGGTADAVDVNDGELGSHKAGAPYEDFTTPSSTFPSELLGNVPDIPLNALPVFGGINHSGNIAVTDDSGDFNFNNVGVYADVGVQTADTAADADDSGDNYFYYGTSFTDDPNVNSDGAGGFPNTLDSFGYTNEVVNHNTTATGKTVAVGDVPAMYDMAEGNGLTGNVDFSALNAEIAAARTAIPAFSPGDLDGNGDPIHFGTIDLGPSFSDGKIDKSMHPDDKGFGVSGDITASASSKNDGGTFLVTVNHAGLTVIDFDVDSGKEILVSNYNFVIDGPEGAFVIVRIPDDSEFSTSQGNVLAGTGGVGCNAIVLVTLNTVTEEHFDFQNSVLNGVAFWSLTDVDGTINHSNTQGCSQFIGDIIDMDNVRYIHCTLPEPATLALLALGGLALIRRRSS